jgi:hypothetical protein
VTFILLLEFLFVPCTKNVKLRRREEQQKAFGVADLHKNVPGEFRSCSYQSNETGILTRTSN